MIIRKQLLFCRYSIQFYIAHNFRIRFLFQNEVNQKKCTVSILQIDTFCKHLFHTSTQLLNFEHSFMMYPKGSSPSSQPVSVKYIFYAVFCKFVSSLEVLQQKCCMHFLFPIYLILLDLITLIGGA